MTLEQVLKRSSKTIRVRDSYISSLHYLLLIDEGELEPVDEPLQLEDTTNWEQAMDDEMFRLHKCVALSSTKVEYVAIAEARR